MADIVRCAGQAFIGTQSQMDQLATPKSVTGHLALPHRRAGVIAIAAPAATYDHHLLQLMSKPIAHDARERAPTLAQARERELLPPATSMPSSPCRATGPSRIADKRLHLQPVFHASAETLIRVARDPRHLGAEIGFFSVLHIGISALQFHPHIHCGPLRPRSGLQIIPTGSPAGAPSSCPLAFSRPRLPRQFVAGLRNAFHRA